MQKQRTLSALIKNKKQIERILSELKKKNKAKEFTKRAKKKRKPKTMPPPRQMVWPAAISYIIKKRPIKY